MKDHSKEKFMHVQKYQVSEEYNKSRLDNCIISKLKYLPRSKVYSIIRKGEVRVNGSRCKPHKKLSLGDVIRIPPHTIKENEPKVASKSLVDIVKNSIIFNENFILVINKPVGIASHGGSGISLGLIETVRQIDAKFKNAQLVHRLDKETSGCIVLALRRSVLRKLNQELREFRVEKNYLAVTKGQWPENIRLVESNLKKNISISGERMVKVDPSGKESKTLFNLISKTASVSLIGCKLLTGRTHQLRVQASNLGYPIIGDKKYGDPETNKKFKLKGINRMLLHAESISFPKLDLSWKTNVPDAFKKIMRN